MTVMIIIFDIIISNGNSNSNSIIIIAIKSVPVPPPLIHFRLHSLRLGSPTLNELEALNAQGIQMRNQIATPPLDPFPHPQFHSLKLVRSRANGEVRSRHQHSPQTSKIEICRVSIMYAYRGIFENKDQNETTP
mmetsp:Transcript_16759/g.32625  ORF Transcript_16759/g.32625 Transcript_16759/m.32625 type:complete len:134 (-) Transcript_16759:75-476(-)